MIDIFEVKDKVYFELWKREPKELYDLLCYRWNQFIGLQGDYPTDYLVECGRFSEGVVELFDSNNLMDQFEDYYNEWLVYSKNEQMEIQGGFEELINGNYEQGPPLNSMSHNGVIYRGFKNYLYYLTGKVVNEILEVEVFMYHKILHSNGIYKNSFRTTDTHSGTNKEPVVEIKGLLEWEYNDDRIEFTISKGIKNETFRFIHSKSNPTKDGIENKDYFFTTYGDFLESILYSMKISSENNHLSISN